MADKISVSFLIPAYNDEATIERVVREASNAAQKISRDYEIIVINDMSSDGTGSILERLGRTTKNLKVITHRKNLGYGGTIKELYYKSTKDWQFSVPGDNQIPPGDVEKLLPNASTADMIIGLRVNRDDPPARLRQSRIYNFLLRLLFGIKTTDVNSVRLMKTSILKKIKLESVSAFVDAELVVRAQNLGYRIIEVPIGHRGRTDDTGGGGKLSTILPTIKEMAVFWIKNIFGKF